MDISVFNNLNFPQIYVLKLEKKNSSDIQNFQRRQNKQKNFKAFEININENLKSINNLIRRQSTFKVFKHTKKNNVMEIIT